MTIDERLDRLTERHEALAQTMELIAAAGLRTDEKIARVSDDIVKLRALMAETSSLVNRTARIAESDKPQIDPLEDQ